MTDFIELLNLDNQEFVNEVNNASYSHFLQEADKNENLKILYKKKVHNLIQHFLFSELGFPSVSFAESKIISSFIPVEQLSRIAYVSFMNLNFNVSYETLQKSFNFDNKHLEHLESVLFNELKRINDCDEFPHLENKIDYFNYLLKLEPYFKNDNFNFFMYVNFVHTAKNHLKLNSAGELKKLNLNDEETNFIFKEVYLKNSHTLIKQLKNHLHFDLWNEELLRKFYSDIRAPNPYDISFSRINDEIKSFEKYNHIIGKINLMEKFENKLSQKESKKSNKL